MLTQGPPPLRPRHLLIFGVHRRVPQMKATQAANPPAEVDIPAVVVDSIPRALSTWSPTSTSCGEPRQTCCVATRLGQSRR